MADDVHEEDFAKYWIWNCGRSVALQGFVPRLIESYSNMNQNVLIMTLSNSFVSVTLVFQRSDLFFVVIDTALPELSRNTSTKAPFQACSHPSSFSYASDPDSVFSICNP